MEKIIMIDLSQVERIKWDKARGQKLKALRGKRSRAEIERKTGLSNQYIKDIEDARYKGIEPEILNKICEAIGTDIYQIIPMYTLHSL
jgi:DNA-binding Xre family transcriptional regulator